MHLYFVRHGESEANTRHIISNRESSFGLTERGRAQAAALAEQLKTVAFQAFYCSPIRRAQETADILAPALGLSYEVTEALREYDCGILEEQGDQASWDQHRLYYESWVLQHNYTHKPEGGECFEDIRQRFLPLIESVQVQSADPVLLVGHGGLFNLMLPLVLTNIDDAFVSTHWIGNTEYILAELQGDRFVCRQWCGLTL